MNVYDFSVKTESGEEKSLANYKGKVLIIANTASKCGFTPQYKDLQDLYDKYKTKGLDILGFPCNQFGGQEPGTNKDVQNFCRGYGVSFQIFAKIDVRGENAHPLYKFLTKEKGFEGFDKSHPTAPYLMDALRKHYPEYLTEDGKDWSFTKFYLEDEGIKWNFTKFLIDREGNVVKRFEPTTEPADMAPDIEKLL
ncbi:MAG: glutathione peroxidase [Schwartzia sp.]|nr:glutathione peroxidase [Schwartzia sp. (in: firmicutes)]